MKLPPQGGQRAGCVGAIFTARRVPQHFQLQKPVAGGGCSVSKMLPRLLRHAACRHGRPQRQTRRLQPLARLVDWAAAGCEPSRMGIGPVPAVERLFARTGMSWDDIDLVELNEAFAPQVLAVLKGWGWDDRDRLNVNGSGISLGHPIGATGGRILANLLRELKRRGGRYGLETMCIGGGQGIAAVFEAA